MTSSLSFRHLIGWFACARLSDSQLIPSGGTFSSTLTTMAFDHSSLRCFGACSCKPTPRGPPSSPVQPRGALSPTYPNFVRLCKIDDIYYKKNRKSVKTELRTCNSHVYISIGSDIKPEAKVMTYLGSLYFGYLIAYERNRNRFRTKNPNWSIIL